MATRRMPVHNVPTLPPGRALATLREQIRRLESLDGSGGEDSSGPLREWEHLTAGIIAAAFGSPSSELHKFQQILTLRLFDPGDKSPQARWADYANQHLALLRALVALLGLRLPESGLRGAYQPGEEYDFYKDLSSIVEATAHDVLFVDAYLDEEVFNLYVSKVSKAAKVRILSNRIGKNVEVVARKFANARPLELRSSPDIHDRCLFLDQRGWVVGQSIKDAARKKPTYLVEIGEPILSISRSSHETIWLGATRII